MGRKKLPIEPMKDLRRRLTTAQKRRLGLLKKAMELAILSDGDVQVFMWITMSDPRGPPEVLELNSLWRPGEDVYAARRSFMAMVKQKPIHAVECLQLEDYNTLSQHRYTMPAMHPLTMSRGDMPVCEPSEEEEVENVARFIPLAHFLPYHTGNAFWIPRLPERPEQGMPAQR